MHVAIKAALLRQIPDEAGTFDGRWLSANVDRSLVRMKDTNDHPHRRGFAGPVGTDETVDGTFRDSKRKIIHGSDIAVSFGHVGNLTASVTLKFSPDNNGDWEAKPKRTITLVRGNGQGVAAHVIGQLLSINGARPLLRKRRAEHPGQATI